MSTYGSFKIDPFKKMCIVFEGEHTKDEIKKTARQVGRQCKFERTGKKKYQMIGSIAIELAKGEPFTEMRLLRCVVASSDRAEKFYKVATDCARKLANAS